MSKRKAEDDEDDFASNKFMKKVDTDDDDDDEDEDEGSDDGKKYEILKEDDIEGNASNFLQHILVKILGSEIMFFIFRSRSWNSHPRW